jgi:hypothetical protein
VISTKVSFRKGLFVSLVGKVKNLKRFNEKMRVLSDSDHITCKFADICGLSSSESYTCTHGGGRYCGKYRVLNAMKSKNEKLEKATVQLNIV